MIKASELRVGNWVKYRDKYGIVKAIHNNVNKKEIDVDNMDLPNGSFSCCLGFEEFNPIPLTSEILISAGFVFNEESRSYRIFSHKQEWILAAQQTTDKTCFKIGLPVDSRSDQYMTNSIYVHQLQNLYFALTGQEIEINL